jgi:NAD-dependent deacetylase
MKTIIPRKNIEYLEEAAEKFRRAAWPAALTGAGISVNSGIADFRSPGGVWTIFSPEEYATLDIFHKNPQKAWQLYRALGKEILGKKPNQAHKVLAELEEKGFLKGLVTQNVDNLHQAAGSKNVLEIHGDHQHLQCLRCDTIIQVTESHYTTKDIPLCADCHLPLKPNVVLFGEAVRNMGEIEELMVHCDLLLVIGRSAKVYPAAGLPMLVKERGGLIYEFNREQSLSVPGYAKTAPVADYFFEGDLSSTLPLFARSMIDSKKLHIS